MSSPCLASKTHSFVSLRANLGTPDIVYLGKHQLAGQLVPLVHSENKCHQYYCTWKLPHLKQNLAMFTFAIPPVVGQDSLFLRPEYFVQLLMICWLGSPDINGACFRILVTEKCDKQLRCRLFIQNLQEFNRQHCNQSVRAYDLGKLLLLGVSGTMVKKSIPSVCIECITASVPVRVLFLLTPTKKSIHLSLDIRFEVTASEPNKCYLSIYQAVLRKLNLAALDTIPLSLLTLTLMLTLKQSKPVLNN